MLRMVKRMLALSGEHKKKLKWAFFISFIEGLFTIMPEILVMLTVYRIATDSIQRDDVALISGLLVGSVVMRALMRRLVDGLQSGTGYLMFARERMLAGEHLKRLPMGYFSEGAIGNVTSVITSDIVFAEQFGMSTLSKIVNAWISMVLGSIMLLSLDWRIGLIAITTFIMGIFALQRMDLVSKEHGKKRQIGYSRLTGQVVEFIKGIAVIKAFNLTGDRFKQMNDAFKAFRDNAIAFEHAFAPTYLRFHHVFAFGTGAVVLALSVLGLRGDMPMAVVVVMLIYIFQFFRPFQVLGSVAALVRIMEAGLDRYEAVMSIPAMDLSSQPKELNTFDISFDAVSFAYDDKNVIEDMSFSIPEKSMTALVGKSGCGKTTVTNLIARFWDVQSGAVSIGGVNVKELSSESLLKHVSVVFQNVYLFQDTILNNIRLGKPEATMEEIIVACKKARCYDFIMALEKGFETMVEEGGVSLSGGEKQRISIARAILKNAPIVLLDEATANIDPDNEAYIQEAINALVMDKTLVVIAHKLSTIQHADQILVMDKGRIVEKGTHTALMEEAGIYASLWAKRMRARSWKITKKMEGSCDEITGCKGLN